MAATNTGSMDRPKSNATEELLSCAVCLEIYINPKSLNCLHTFCAPCLEKIQDRIKKWIMCPLCKAQTPIPANGIKGLPNDFKIDQIKEIWQSEDGVTQCTKQRFCNVCEGVDGERKFAEFHCDKCMVFYCPTCVAKHNDSLMFATHHAASLSTDTSTNSTNLCSNHPTHIVTYQCQTCKPHSLLCPICILSHNQNHNTMDLAEVPKVIRKELQDHLQEVHNSSNKFHEYLSKTDEERDYYEKMLTAVQEGISKSAMVMIAEVEKEELRLLQVAQNRIEGFMSKFNQANVVAHLGNCELVKKELDEVLKGSDETCAAMHQQLLEQIKHLNGFTLPKAVPRSGIQFIPKEAASMKVVLGSFKDVKPTTNDDERQSTVKGPAPSRPPAPPPRKARKPPQPEHSPPQQQQEIQSTFTLYSSSSDSSHCDCCKEEKAPLIGLYCMQERRIERLCQKCRKMHDIVGHLGPSKLLSPRKSENR